MEIPTASSIGIALDELLNQKTIAPGENLPPHRFWSGPHLGINGAHLWIKG